MKNDRRDFLKQTCLASVGFAGVTIIPEYSLKMASLPSSEKQSADALSLLPLNRLPRMVREYFVKHVRQIEKSAINRRSSMVSRNDAENYVKDVREKIQKCFGPWPEKTPLNARVTGIVKRDNYKIEKIIFESRPGFQVTANLYIPERQTFPLPAVIGTCGHLDNGKVAPVYQSFAQGLAKMGYVVLIYDPIGQGERLQYLNSELKPRHGFGTNEHIFIGNQLIITGESQPNTCGNKFLDAYDCDYFYAGHSIMLDYPYVGQKTFDVLLVINFLKSYGHEEIYLIGKGWGAIPATFAALLSDAVTQVTLKNALTSYTDVAENEDYNWPLASLLPGVLKTFDLPDCYSALALKNLRQIEPWNNNAGQ